MAMGAEAPLSRSVSLSEFFSWLREPEVTRRNEEVGGVQGQLYADSSTVHAMRTLSLDHQCEVETEPQC